MVTYRNLKERFTLNAVNDAIEIRRATGDLPGTVSINVSGITGTITLQFEAKPQGAPDASYTAVAATPLAGGATVTSTSAAGAWRVIADGLDVRVRASAVGPGTADVELVANVEP